MIRVVGLPSDAGSSFLRGAAGAPPRIREALWSPAGNPFTESLLELGVDVPWRDEGDLPLDGMPEDDRQIEAAIEGIARAGDVPISLGGDHAVTAPVVRALARVHGPLEILHVDAHPDLYERFGDDPRSHASPFARILEAGAARRLVQVGIRTMTRHQAEQARRYGVEVVPAAGLEVTAVPVLGAPLYVSLDLDGLDPAFAPGVAHPEPGGLSVRDVLDLLGRQRASVVGADVVELNPARDPQGLTATVAAKLVKELAAMVHRNRGERSV